LVDVACAEVRNIAHDLKPGALQDLGLVGAIKDMLNRYNKVDGIEIIFQNYGFDHSKQINQNDSLQIYRIIQELVHNAIKHSGAKELLVQISLKDLDLEVIVEDDGSGFTVNTINRGMGLENIQSRVNYLKGELHIDSKPGKGTSFLLHIPVSYI
jgi:signal transduction histidine kinase